MFNVEETSKKSKEAVDGMMKNYSSMTKGLQAIATEAADFSKKSMEDGMSHFEKLSKVKSIEAAVELQTGFVKSAFETYMAEMTKMAEMYADLAKGAYKSAEAPAAKVTAAVKTAAAA